MKSKFISLSVLIFLVFIIPVVNTTGYELDPGSPSDSNWTYLRSWTFRLKNYGLERNREVGDYDMYYHITEYINVYDMCKISFEISYHKVLSLEQYNAHFYEDFDLFFVVGAGNSFVPIDLPDTTFTETQNINGDDIVDMKVSHSDYFTCPKEYLVGICSSGEGGTYKYTNVLMFKAGYINYSINPDEILAIIANGVDYVYSVNYYCAMLDWFPLYSSFSIPYNSWFYYGISWGNHVLLQMYDGTIVDTYYL